MSERPAGTSLSTSILRGLLLLIILALFGSGLWWIQKTGLLQSALEWIRDLGAWGPIAFIVLYVVTVALFVPALILTVGGGFIYGLGWGSVYVFVAATIAANVNFLIARYLARGWIVRKLERFPKFKAIDDAVAREGWKIVALVRFAPVFPFSVTSYAFGLTRVPLWEYFLANFAMIPGTLMYIYFGTLARDLTEKVAPPSWIKWSIGAVALAVVLYVTRFAKRALSQRMS